MFVYFWVLIEYLDHGRKMGQTGGILGRYISLKFFLEVVS